MPARPLRPRCRPAQRCKGLHAQMAGTPTHHPPTPNTQTHTPPLSNPGPACLRVFKVADAGVQVVDHEAGQLAVHLAHLGGAPAGGDGTAGTSIRHSSVFDPSCACARSQRQRFLCTSVFKLCCRAHFKAAVSWGRQEGHKPAAVTPRRAGQVWRQRCTCQTPGPSQPHTLQVVAGSSARPGPA